MKLLAYVLKLFLVMAATQHCYFADGGMQFNTFGFISHISKIAMLRCYHDIVSLCACGCSMFYLRSCMVSLQGSSLLVLGPPPPPYSWLGSTESSMKKNCLLKDARGTDSNGAYNYIIALLFWWYDFSKQTNSFMNTYMNAHINAETTIIYLYLFYLLRYSCIYLCTYLWKYSLTYWSLITKTAMP